MALNIVSTAVLGFSMGEPEYVTEWTIYINISQDIGSMGNSYDFIWDFYEIIYYAGLIIACHIDTNLKKSANIFF